MFRRFLVPMLVFAAVSGGVVTYLAGRPVHHEPGMLVAKPPVQMGIPIRALPPVAGWHINAVAAYHLCGRVLGTKRYYGDKQADLVPVDVAMGWRRMSDQAVLDRLTISMGNRFYFYEWQHDPPIPQNEIVVSSSNNHVIPANKAVGSVIGSVRTGQLLTMDGYLVNATSPDGVTWNSSLTRTDTGNGACELFYVEKASAVDVPDVDM